MKFQCRIVWVRLRRRDAAAGTCTMRGTEPAKKHMGPSLLSIFMKQSAGPEGPGRAISRFKKIWSYQKFTKICHVSPMSLPCFRIVSRYCIEKRIWLETAREAEPCCARCEDIKRLKVRREGMLLRM